MIVQHCIITFYILHMERKIPIPSLFSSLSRVCPPAYSELEPESCMEMHNEIDSKDKTKLRSPVAKIKAIAVTNPSPKTLKPKRAVYTGCNKAQVRKCCKVSRLNETLISFEIEKVNALAAKLLLFLHNEPHPTQDTKMSLGKVVKLAIASAWGQGHKSWDPHESNSCLHSTKLHPQEGEAQEMQNPTEKKASKKVKNHHVTYTVTAKGKRTALQNRGTSQKSEQSCLFMTSKWVQGFPNHPNW